MLRSQIEQDYLNKFIVQGTIWQHIRLYTHKHTDVHTHTSAYYRKKSEKSGWKLRSTR